MLFVAVLMITFYPTRGNRPVVSFMAVDSRQEGNMQYIHFLPSQDKGWCLLSVAGKLLQNLRCPSPWLLHVADSPFHFSGRSVVLIFESKMSIVQTAQDERPRTT